MQYLMLDGVSCFVPESAAEDNLVGVMLKQIVDLQTDSFEIKGGELRDGPFFTAFAAIPIVRSVGLEQSESTRTVRHQKDAEAPKLCVRVLVLKLALACDFYDLHPPYVVRIDRRTSKETLAYLADCLALLEPGFTAEQIEPARCIEYIRRLEDYVGFVRAERAMPRGLIRHIRRSGGVPRLHLPQPAAQRPVGERRKRP